MLFLRNGILKNENERKAGYRESHLLALGVVQQHRRMDSILNVLELTN
jgi:hypothetical protein